MLLSAPLLTEVPNGLDLRHAALTEPMAVGPARASTSRSIKPGEGALVLGCGPVGLAVIAALKLKGIEPIVATDFSPARRALALTMGATEAVDPAAEVAFDAWSRGRASGKTLVRVRGDRRARDHRRRAARRPARHRGSSSSACAWSTTRSTRSSASPRSSASSSCLGYDPMEFAGTLRSIAEGEHRRRPDDHRRGRPRRRGRRLRRARQPRRSTARSSSSRRQP